jgi:hypothetical protein
MTATHPPSAGTAPPVSTPSVIQPPPDKNIDSLLEPDHIILAKKGKRGIPLYLILHLPLEIHLPVRIHLSVRTCPHPTWFWTILWTQPR